MDIHRAFALAFRNLRKSAELTQEDFSTVSSRTYVSVLERGLKSPTLEKINELSQVLQMHPLTLLTLTYLYKDGSDDLEGLLNIIDRELKELMYRSENLS